MKNTWSLYNNHGDETKDIRSTLHLYETFKDASAIQSFALLRLKSREIPEDVVLPPPVSEVGTKAFGIRKFESI